MGGAAWIVLAILAVQVFVVVAVVALVIKVFFKKK